MSVHGCHELRGKKNVGMHVNGYIFSLSEREKSGGELSLHYALINAVLIS
jgi:hypothetical protein